ncbi:MAG: 2,3,4,5-tetrahydropyridine-2,6-dicarboxylate N-acetyltransferase [Synergistaceae bacterium]|nr:2,3,4,5-tetrahydropyridine-2,6-dicarboxylate N-acetyltransferase [Synergistaceae bacterium]
MDTKEIIRLIKESPKSTHARAYIAGELDGIDFSAGNAKFVGGKEFGLLTGDFFALKKLIGDNPERIKSYDIQVNDRNSGVPLADLTRYEARIEPGAIIRDRVDIGKAAVIMMGAVINIGAAIGAGTMIDMNAVIGGRAIIGDNCHIGAGAVIAGVIEPESAIPVTIGNKVLVGANAVILEGVQVGEGSVVAAGAIVANDVPPGVVVAGVPAKVIKEVDEKTTMKTAIVADLRQM